MVWPPWLSHHFLTISLRDAIRDSLSTSLLEDFFFLLFYVLLTKLFGVFFSLHSKEKGDSFFPESTLSKKVRDDSSKSLPFHFFFLGLRLCLLAEALKSLVS